jgi:hypothetical protein
MKNLMSWLAGLLGFYFAGDNQVVPVLRLGRFSRIKGPGFFWIMPFVDRPLRTLNTGLRVAKFIFSDVLSRDNVPFKFHLTILFLFDPGLPQKKVAAQLVRAPDDLLQSIVQDYANQGLRRLAATFDAKDLGGQVATSTMERNLTRFLIFEMRSLGIAPLRNGGVIIKETIAPENFLQATLNARRIETVLQSLAHFPVPGLIDQALQADLVMGLERLKGNLTLLSTFSPLETIEPSYLLDLAQLSKTRQFGRNGH